MSAVLNGFQLSSTLWAPQRRGIEETIGLLGQGRSVCLMAPTGGGKTRMAGELIRWASYHGVESVFYTNRRLLVGQTFEKFEEMGLDVGVRCVDWEDQDRGTALVQICSIDTERQRVHKTKQWTLAPAGLVIVDEAHMNRSKTMEDTIRSYQGEGAHIVLLSATPLGISHLVDELVVSGTMQEYRDCGALVMAAVYSILQPDMSKIKRNLTGEFILDGQKKKIFTQQIIGDVYDVAIKEHNPDLRPFLAYAPGKPESLFVAKYLCDRGVRCAHIDASEVWMNGKRYPRSRGVWDDLLGQFVDGKVSGISSRFVLREGIDVPSAFQSVLATPIGSMGSYVQVCGRVLRRSVETPDEVVISDLGGNYHRHGSPNATRPWREWFHMTSEQVSSQIERIRREGEAKEPIRCPQCGLERPSGIKCPKCGFQHERGMRKIVMLDGTVKLVEGDLIKPIRTQRRSDTEKKWTDMFWAWRRSRNTQQKSLAQLEGFFAHQHGYHPPRDLPFMPRNSRDWFQRVSTVDFELLNSGR